MFVFGRDCEWYMLETNISSQKNSSSVHYRIMFPRPLLHLRPYTEQYPSLIRWITTNKPNLDKMINAVTASSKACWFYDSPSRRQSTYLSPRTLRRESIGTAREDSLACRKQHLDKVVTVLLGLALVLTQLRLLGWRQPGRLLQLRQFPQRQSVQRVPADNRNIMSVGSCQKVISAHYSWYMVNKIPVEKGILFGRCRQRLWSCCRQFDSAMACCLLSLTVGEKNTARGCRQRKGK